MRGWQANEDERTVTKIVGAEVCALACVQGGVGEAGERWSVGNLLVAG